MEDNVRSGAGAPSGLRPFGAEPPTASSCQHGIPNAALTRLARDISDIVLASTSGHSGGGQFKEAVCYRAGTGRPRLAQHLGSVLHGAFSAGWLSRHHRQDVEPEDAWQTYLNSMEPGDD